MGAVRVKCAKCGASLFTSSAGRKKVEEPPENRLCTCEHWETDHGIDKYCKSANCVCDKFTAAKPEIVMGQAVMRPYKEIHVRELVEFTQNDFITMMISLGTAYVEYHDGIFWSLAYDNSKAMAMLKDDDIRVVAEAYYCFMQYTPFIKTENNLTIPVVCVNSQTFKTLAKMAWAKKNE